MTLIFKNSSFAILDKIISAFIQLASIPVLLSVYGKENFGLISIASSINILLIILNFGLPTGFPKFIATWIASKDRDALYSSGGTILSIYIILGLFGAISITLLAFHADAVFSVSDNQVELLRALLLITAITSFVSMPASYIDQLLIGAQDLWFVSVTNVAKNCLYVLLIVSVHREPTLLSLVWFYAIQSAIAFSMIGVKVYRWRLFGSTKAFHLRWRLQSAGPVIKYSATLMTFSIFIMLDNALKPIIISTLSNDASKQMAEFQIVGVFRTFLLMIAAAVMQAIIPYITQRHAEIGDRAYTTVIFTGTKVTWALGAFLGAMLIQHSVLIVSMYAGKDAENLAPLVDIYVLCTMYNIYTICIASAILSSGKLVPLGWATAIGFIISTTISLALIQSLQLKAIAYSLVGYNMVHFLILHMYYLPRHFRISGGKLMSRVALPPILASVLSIYGGDCLVGVAAFDNIYIKVIVSSAISLVIYSAILLATYVTREEMGFLRMRCLR